ASEASDAADGRKALPGAPKIETANTVANSWENDLGSSATIAAPSGAGNRLPDDSNATRHGDVMGTPQYMAPEQALGLTDQVGPAADQYALGVMLFELATLRQARSHKSAMEALGEAVQNKLAPHVDIDGDSLHPALSAIIARATQKEPADRYPTVSKFSED